MFSGLRRIPKVVVAIVAFGSLSLAAGLAYAHHKPGHGVAAVPDNPQLGDVITARANNATIGTSPTTLVSIPGTSGATPDVVLRGSLTLQNIDQARGRTVNCNVVSGGSAGLAAATMPPATAAQPIQNQTIHVFGTVGGTTSASLVCSSQPAAVSAVDVQLSAQVVRDLWRIDP